MQRVAPNKGNILYVITSKKGKLIEKISHHGAEKEVLMMSKTKLEVKGIDYVDENGGYWKVILEEK